MTSGDLVPQDIYLVHPTELLEQLPQIVLVHVVRYLTYEHFYVVGVWLLYAIVVHYAATEKQIFMKNHRSYGKFNIQSIVIVTINGIIDMYDRI